MPIDVFLDTSAMPRHVTRPGHVAQQIVDLVNAKLIKTYASTVTIGEWRSQVVGNARQGIEEMHRGLQSALRLKHLERLSVFKELKKLDKAQASVLSEVDDLTKEQCDDLLKRLGINEIPIGPEDAESVFADYFSGTPPFAAAKHRADLPDAFIYRAAVRLSMEHFPRDVLAVCKDARLAGALGSIDRVTVVKDLAELIETEGVQEAMTHLAVFKAWTPKKKKQVLAFLSTGPSFATTAINDFASIELPGTEFSHSSIPVDNSLALIDYVDSVENLEFDWDNLEEIGPGWLVVPFTFECDAGLSLSVFRADAFFLPDWIDVSIGDFEQDYYFEATAERTLQVTGQLSLQYNEKDLKRANSRQPSGIEVEDDIEIDLVPQAAENEW